MGINFNTNSIINNIYFRGTEAPKRNIIPQTPPDTFVRESEEVKYKRILEELFPNNELMQIYHDMCKELEIDYPPKLIIGKESDKKIGGGYYCTKHCINLDYKDLLGSTTKVYGIKDGEKRLQMSNALLLPVIVDPFSAMILEDSPTAAKNAGVDKLVAVPATIEDRRKLVLQKLYHEIIHAQQHMIMRQTEGIGIKEVFKAWHHAPKNLNPAQKLLLDNAVEKNYKDSFWATHPTETKYTYDSEMGQLAQKYLDGVQNYTAVDSAEYLENILEKEAYQKSAEYIIERYGEWT